ncbi:MAG: four helix bundle protein [Chloroflexota bacterium]
MATSLEELKVLQVAEGIADGIWTQVVRWDEFPRDVVGKQLTRAADSIGANIAESFGRFNYGEKLQFLYYARGSLFETKYWLNRTSARNLLPSSETKNYVSQLTDLARQLNAFASNLKSQRRDEHHPKAIREAPAEYVVWTQDDTSPLFTQADLEWLESISNL